MQIGEGSPRDEPKQEKPSVSVKGDLGPSRPSVKRVFSPHPHLTPPPPLEPPYKPRNSLRKWNARRKSRQRPNRLNGRECCLNIHRRPRRRPDDRLPPQRLFQQAPHLAHLFHPVVADVQHPRHVPIHRRPVQRPPHPPDDIVDIGEIPP